MSLPSILVAGLAPPLWSRADLEAAYAEALRQLDVAQQAAKQSAHATQILANRMRSADQYLMTAPDNTPIDELRRDLRALLVGGMN